jgi:uncharacterized protein YeaO (DUF488 family)
MALKLKTFRIGGEPRRGEGLRLGVVRFLPRGVLKKDYQRLGLFDLWFPALAPSRKLLEKRDQGLFRRYRSELLKSSEKRQTLLLLAEVAKKIPISIGCSCEQANQCHRSVLASLLEEAGSGKLPEK